MRLLLLAALLVAAAPRAHAQPAAPKPVPPSAAPLDVFDTVQQLLAIGACGPQPPKPLFSPPSYEAHCKAVRAAQESYRKQWLAPATEFFRAHVPPSAPKRVVYPFAGGDLATALTVYPDADEITTISLEPAGDPTTLRRMTDKDLPAALAPVAKELTSLYRHNYSKTMDMVSAMTGARLPTQLIFSLSALSIHGYELTGARYFTLSPEGGVRYLTDDDARRIEALPSAVKRNREYGNVELRFRRPGGREQIYRHLLANLDDAHLQGSPVLLHLERKGRIAAMTKAASYLLTFENFKTMRRYLLDHVDWMVSDSTGLAPKFGTPAGFEYEVWGQYEVSNMAEGKWITPQWRALYAAQPRRPLKFRFGYPSGKPQYAPHLIIMRKASPAPAMPAPAPAPR